jgi:hypothetical protein
MRRLFDLLPRITLARLPDAGEHQTHFVVAGFIAGAAPSKAGFLKSRVYAKLLKRLIFKCYQTFNKQPWW